MVTPFFPLIIFVFYTVGFSKSVSDTSAVSIWSPFTAAINIVIIILFTLGVVYGFLTMIHYIKHFRESYKNLSANQITLLGKVIKKFGRKLYNYIKEQINPVLQTNEVYEKKIGKKILFAASNFAAITSLTTTFVGLLLFFWDDITTGNIMLRVINVIICLGFTAAIQYFLLVAGIHIGKLFAKHLRYFCNEKNKIDWWKTIYRRAIKVFYCTLLLGLYIIPMLGSTLFSFSALFAANAKICGYQEIVNDNVWNVASECAKKAASDVVNVYVSNNTEIMNETEQKYLEYDNYSTALNVWEDNNVSTGSDIANTVDNLVMEYNEQVNGIEDYKNALIRALLNDASNSYEIKSKETKLYHMRNDQKAENLFTSLKSIEIVSPYSLQINLIDDGSPLFTKYVAKDNTPTQQQLDKFQFIDVMFREFVNKLVITKNTVENAEMLNVKIEVVGQYSGKKAEDLDIEAYIDKYSKDINENKLIYNSYLSIKEILKNELIEDIDAGKHFDSVDKIPIYMNLYAMSNGKDNLSLDNKISRLVKILNCLPDIENIDDSEKKNSISDTIGDIGEYYNYAKSRNGSFSFALDVLWGKGSILNECNADINDIYTHTYFTRILFGLAFVIDILAVLSGFFSRIFFKEDK